MMLTVRRSSSAHIRVQGGEPWRIFWASAPPFSLEEKMGGAYTFPRPRLMFGRKALISDEGQTLPLDVAALYPVIPSEVEGSYQSARKRFWFRARKGFHLSVLPYGQAS